MARHIEWTNNSKIYQFLEFQQFFKLKNFWNFQFGKFKKYLIWEIQIFFNNLLTNLRIDQIFKIDQFVKLSIFKNFTICKIHILRFEKLLNILGVRVISKKWKNKLEIKISNNSFFVILIFEILEFRNVGHSSFGRSKFWDPTEFERWNYNVDVKATMQTNLLTVISFDDTWNCLFLNLRY